ncbi:LacI family DNA-binding transcriptional regulator [Streptomyces sp. AS02]|uniref:LacI family DNA-binding transcriptional regulator n=1 Tax=Streptomyces sp. AS02 TaxID=2938946 RepID=UPI0020210182|nr:substrate-binding domain-containing protein [Streptomyces sp. AS02]MCL8013783.1 substrate-binding domain-containing protein [Streptomyces sp. AS02]
MTGRPGGDPTTPPAGAAPSDAGPADAGPAHGGDHRTHTLGLLYPPSGRARDYTTMQLAFVGGIAEAAAPYGYDVLLSPADTGDAPSFRRMLGQRPEGGDRRGDGGGRRVDGVIVMEIRREDGRVEQLVERGFPFVAIGRNHRADEAGWVDLDFAGLASGCVRHLADLGHHRIAFVNRSAELFNSGYGFARLGHEGYVTAMADLGHEPRAYLCGEDLASGEEVVARILAEDPATTSLVTMNEAALEGVYRGLTRHGRAVPRDFSVVGVAASPWAEQVTPQLTAAEIPAKEMSRVAVELMVERLRSSGSTPRHVLLKPLITLRSSTGRCRPVPGSEPEPEFPDFDVDF